MSIDAYLDSFYTPQELLRMEMHDLCKYGISKARAGECDVLSFELWSLEEAVLVREYMTEHAPDIPYARTWIAGGPDTESP